MATDEVSIRRPQCVLCADNDDGAHAERSSEYAAADSVCSHFNITPRESKSNGMCFLSEIMAFSRCSSSRSASLWCLTGKFCAWTLSRLLSWYYQSHLYVGLYIWEDTRQHMPLRCRCDFRRRRHMGFFFGAILLLFVS